MKQEDIINEFYDLEYFLILLIEEHKDEIVYKSKVLQVPVTLIETKVKLHSSQLEKLIQHKKPDKIPSFKYLEDYGIKFKTYYEIAIDIKSHLYGPYDDLG